MSETAAELIASAFAKPPTHVHDCPFDGCEWTSRAYYNPGDARAARLQHVNISHGAITNSQRTENQIEYLLNKPGASLPEDRANRSGMSPRGYRVW